MAQYERHNLLAGDRKIDERDIDGLLASLTDKQIADVFNMEESEVSGIRKARRRKVPARKSNKDTNP